MKRLLPTHLYTQQVSIYRNLSDHCLSVLHKQHVADHAGGAILQNVRFRVQESTRQTVIKRGRKKPHAFVDGVLMQCSEKQWGLESDDGIQVSYNPYRAGYFYNRLTGEPVHQARLCVVTPAGIVVYF